MRRPICFTGNASLQARRPFIGKSSQTNPGDADALYQFGVIQAKMRNFPAAIQLIDQAIEFGSDNAALISDRGIVLQNLNRWDDALADYDRALAIKPGYPEALNNRGVVLHELKRFAEALVSFDRALALTPTIPMRFIIAVVHCKNCSVLMRRSPVTIVRSRSSLTMSRRYTSLAWPDF